MNAPKPNPGYGFPKNMPHFVFQPAPYYAIRPGGLQVPSAFSSTVKFYPPQSALPAGLFGRFSGSNAVFPALFCKNIQTSSKKYANHRIDLAFNFGGLYNESHLKSAPFYGFPTGKTA